MDPRHYCLVEAGPANPRAATRLIEALAAEGIRQGTRAAPSSNAGTLVLTAGRGAEALDGVRQGRREGGGCVLVIETSPSTAPARGAWELLEAGADDVLAWDGSPEAVAAVACRLRRAAEVSELLELPLVRQHLVGASQAWQRTLRQVIEAARFTDSAILLSGETGTGKELVARLIHTLDPRNGKGELIVLDCTTVVPDLSGSEFFGHERGAFTHAVVQREGAFALAERGTLFLDEVGELPASLQAELLRVVQEKTFKRVGSNTWRQASFRLVCATHRDLKAHAGNGEFRADFYHRIASWTIRLPPLRERREDILPLARHFAAEALQDDPGTNGGRPVFDPAVEEFLLARDYAGNVRELRQLAFRIAKRHVGPAPITVGDLPEDDREAVRDALSHERVNGEFEAVMRRALASGAGLREIKEHAAEVVIKIALQDAGGNVRQAAIRLGITDRALQMRRAAGRDTANGGDSAVPVPQ